MLVRKWRGLRNRWRIRATYGARATRNLCRHDLSHD